MSALVAMLLAERAEAQGAKPPSGYKALADIAGIKSHEMLPDGSMKIVLANGRSLIVPADQVVQTADGLMIAPEIAATIVAMQAPTSDGNGVDLSAALPILGTIALGGVGVALMPGKGSDSEGAATPQGNNRLPTIDSAATAAVAENQAATGLTVHASDPDNDAVRYAIAGGADAAKFAIDPSSGALSFIAAPDFEAKGDTNGDNVYEVVVSASDGKGSTTQAVRISVTNVNDVAPAITSVAAASVAENRTDTGLTIRATDAEGDAISYAIAGGADAAKFVIDAATGALRFAAAPDFEAKADANGDNVYEVTVRASDGTNTTTQAVRITVTDVNDVAPAIGSAATISVAENRTATGLSVRATDVEGGTLAYAIAGGADAAKFVIDAATGALSFAAAPDFEAKADANGDNVYEVTVRASDGVNSATQGVRVTVTDVNDVAPVNTIPTGAAGNQGATIALAGLSVTDADSTALTTVLTVSAGQLGVVGASGGAAISGNGTAQLTLTGGAAQINATLRTLTFSGGSGFSGTSDLVITTGDGNFTDRDTFRIDVARALSGVIQDGYIAGAQLFVDLDGDGVLDANEASTTSDAAGNFTLFGNGAGRLIGTGGTNVDTGLPNRIVLTAPAGSAVVNPLTTLVQSLVETGVSVDAANGMVSASFGLPTGTNLSLLDPLASGTAGSLALVAQRGAAQVATILDAAIQAVGASGGTTTVARIAEMVRAGSIDLSNPDIVATLYADLPLDDAARAKLILTTASVNADIAQAATLGEISATQRASAAPGFDYAPVTRDDTASVVVQKSITISPTANDADPEGGALRIVRVGDRAVTTGTPVVLESGTVLLNSDGSITFTSAAGLAGRTVALGYTVVDAAGNEADGVISIAITPNQAPAIQSAASISVAENLLATGLSVVATDAEGEAIGYAIAGGADAAKFAINATSGALSFRVAPDFEARADSNGDNIYEVIVSASDGGRATTQAVRVNVTNVNDVAPTITSSAAASVPENRTATGLTVRATDIEGDRISYAIAGGVDAAKFAIDTSTGALSFIAAPDFEIKADADGDNVYVVIVSASDGTNIVTQRVEISVTDLNDVAPVIRSAATVSVAENQTVTGLAVQATDVEGGTLAYAIAGGNDAAKFRIDAATGALSFVAAPDFEARADANGDNIYEVTVRASDGVNAVTQAVRVTVTNVNDVAPVIGSSATVSVAENRIATGLSVRATDVDGGTITFALAGGADAAKFAIDATTGALSFVAAPDFEAKADANGDNVYEVIVRASDGVNATTQAVRVTVTNVNDVAPVIDSVAAISVAENRLATGLAVHAIDSEGDPVAYAIAGGTDAARFAIDTVTGALSFVAAPDFETRADTNADNVYEVTVRASDGVNAVTQAVRINVTNVNDVAPVIGSPAAISVAENIAATGLTVSANDAEGDAIAYTVAGGADAARFRIDAVTGALSFAAAPDFEARADANGDNVYDVIIRASDGVNNVTQAVAVTVTNVNDVAPVIGSPATISIAENSLVTGLTVQASDVDGGAIRYGVIGGTDAAKFAIDSITGALSFVAAPDFEARSDANGDNVYEVIVGASDGLNVTSQAVRVTVTNVNDVAPVLLSPTAVSVAENSLSSGLTVRASDAEGDAITYAIVGGADAAKFAIDGSSGTLSFVAAPDFEARADADGDNIYEVAVRAFDGVNAVTQAVRVTVTNLNDVAPVITSAAAISVAENALATGLSATATDVEGDAISFTLAGGADAARFAIDATTGALSFIATPDFETRGDANGDNIYEVNVRAFDGANATTQAVRVTVTNVNDVAPAITSPAAISVAENSLASGLRVQATDVEGDAIAYAITGGTDAAKFAIDAVTGALSFIAAPDFEARGDANGDNVYEVNVRAFDGANATTQAVRVTVTNVNDVAPVIDSAAIASVAENSIATGIAVHATDVEGDAITYAITGGVDAARFTIDAATGALAFASAPNFEAPADANADNVYEVAVRASDGVNATAQTVRITVTNLNDSTPVITSAATIAVAENIVATGLRLQATDGDGDVVSYAIAGGADAARFTIDAATGALSFVAAPDFEAPADADGNNVYQVNLRASDGTNVATQAVSVTVTDVADSAATTFAAGLSVDSGRSASDLVTNDGGLTGSVADKASLTALTLSVDGGDAFDIAGRVDGLGRFSLTESEIETRIGRALSDGAHSYVLSATDRSGTSGRTLAFTLDQTAPDGSAALSRSSDTGEPGDGMTSAGRASFVGAASEAGAGVSFGGRTALADKDGKFTIDDVDLAQGANRFTLTLTDPAGNSSHVSIDVNRVAGAASADQVLYWNDVALEAITKASAIPTYASRALAMQSVAVYDAVSAIDGSTPFWVAFEAGEHAGVDAAIAYASYKTLLHLFPSQKTLLDMRLAQAIPALGTGDVLGEGRDIGLAVADAVIALREQDGYDSFVQYVSGGQVGDYVATGPMYAEAENPQWATLDTFALTSPDQFRGKAPPALDSADYAASINEVKSLGAANSTTRTTDQTQQANFWKDGGGTYTPPGHWNEIAQIAVGEVGAGTASNARTFAILNVALADAAVAAWDSKYFYATWRPITAIHNADLDGNDATVADKTWQPYMNTPPHPDDPSGHSTFSAAGAAVLSNLFGENFSFDLTSAGTPGVVRHFDSFDQASEEAGRSRIYGGIHTQFANETGNEIGSAVGAWVLGAFARTDDVTAPRITFAQDSGVATASVFSISGAVIDNLSGTTALTLSIDGAAATPVAFGKTGGFTVDVPAPRDGSFDGTHIYRFSAIDAAGNQADPVDFTVKVDTRAPVVALSSFVEGAALAVGARLSGAVDGTGSTVTSLSYTVDGGKAQTLTFNPTSGAFDTSFNLGRLAAGDHVVAFRATDAAGNIGTSEAHFSIANAAPFTITRVYPIDGASDIGLTQRPQVSFSRPVDAASLDASSFYATDAAGHVIPANIIVAADKLSAYLFFDGAMPGSQTIRLHLDGTKVKAADGALLDGDADGIAGGAFTASYTTVNNTPVAGTTLTGFVVGPGPDLLPMTRDDYRAGPDGITHTPDDVFLERLAGVKVYILGRESEAVYTDAQGNFTLTNVPAGNIKVAIDGRTATNAPTGVFYPEMVMDITTRPGVANTFMGTMGPTELQLDNLDRGEVYLPRIDKAVLQEISTTQNTDVVAKGDAYTGLTAEERDLMKLVVTPGSVLDANGNPVEGAQVGFSTVPPELVRDMLPEGLLQHTFDITIQAPGATIFAEPLQMTFPNVFNAAPGTKLNFLSFDHTTGKLVIEGTATVSEDGLTVVTDPDTGITKPGWHGLTPPGSESRGPNDPWDDFGDDYDSDGDGVPDGDDDDDDFDADGDGDDNDDSDSDDDGEDNGNDDNDGSDHDGDGEDEDECSVENEVSRYFKKLDTPNVADAIQCLKAFVKSNPVVKGAELLLKVVKAAECGYDAVKNGERIGTKLAELKIKFDEGKTPTAELIKEGGLLLNDVRKSGQAIIKCADEFTKNLPVISDLQNGVACAKVGLGILTPLLREMTLDPCVPLAVRAFILPLVTSVNLASTLIFKVEGLLNKINDGVKGAALELAGTVFGFLATEIGTWIKFIQTVDDKNDVQKMDIVQLKSASLDENGTDDGATSLQRAIEKLDTLSQYLDQSADELGSAAESLEEMIAAANTPEVRSIARAAEGISKISYAAFGKIPNAPYSIHLDNGSVITGFTDAEGGLSIFLPEKMDYFLEIVDLDRRLIATSVGTTAPSGVQTVLGTYSFQRFEDLTDTDQDGLPDRAEAVFGTSISTNDTDGDGLSDIFELQNGLNPLGNFPTKSGEVGSLALGDSIAQVVVAAGIGSGDARVAVVANGAGGIALVDIGAALTPRLLAKLDLPGNAVDVAVDTSLDLAVVAAQTGGLHIVDLSNPTAPERIQTIAGNFDQVEIIDGLVFADSGGALISYELATGDLVQSLDLGDATDVVGLAAEGDHLYAFTAQGDLQIVLVSNGLMIAQGSIDLSNQGWFYNGASRKLFVADGVLYMPTDDGFNGGYATINVADPTHPTIISGPDDRSIAGDAIALNGSGLGIAVGDPGGVFGANAVDVVNTGDPAATGAFVTRYTLAAAPTAVAIGAGFAYVGDVNGGFHVINYSGFDTAGVAPTVTITARPADIDAATPGLQLLEGSTIRFGTRVADDVQVQKVDVLVDGRIISTDLAYPFDIAVDLPTIAGSGSDRVTVQIRATDMGGNIGLSEAVEVQLVPDIVPPQLVASNINEGQLVGKSFRTFSFTFSEPIDPAGATAQAFTLVDANGVARTPSVVQLRDGGRTVKLSFDPLDQGDYHFAFDNALITDRAGNRVGDTLPDRHFRVATFSAEWINPDGGDWNDPANWSNGEVPGEEDDVAIILSQPATITLGYNANARVGTLTSNVTIALDQYATLEVGEASLTNLDIGGGHFIVDRAATVGDLSIEGYYYYYYDQPSVSGDGDLTITHRLDWRYGTMAGDGKTILANGATALIGQPTDPDNPYSYNYAYLARTFEIGGDATIEQSSVYLGYQRYDPALGYVYDEGTLSVLNGGSLDLAGPFADIYAFNSGQGTLRIADGGAVTKSGGGTSDIGVAIEGAIDLIDGDVALRGGAVYRLADGAVIDRLIVDGGKLLIEGNVHIGELVLRSGIVGGEGTLTIDDRLDWYGGQMEGTGRTVIGADATALLGSHASEDEPNNVASFTLARAFDVAGDVTLDRGQMTMGAYAGNDPQTGQAIYATGTISILADGRFELAGPRADVSNYYSLPGNAIDVAPGGTLVKTGAGTATIGVSLDGALAVEDGDIQLAGGTYRLAAGMHLGALSLAGGTLILEAGASVGALTIDYGQLVVEGDASITDLALRNGTIRGDGDLTVTHRLDWTGGAMEGEGRTLVAAQAEAMLGYAVDPAQPGSRVQISLGRNLDIAGHATLEQAQLQLGFNEYDPVDGYVARIGLLSIASGGRLDLSGPYADLDDPYSYRDTVVVASGGILAKTGGGTSSIDAPLVGALTVVEGTVSIGYGGFYRVAAGTHIDALRLEGGNLTLEAGASIGTLDMTAGKLVLAGAASIGNFDMSGGALSGDADLTVSGRLEWDGGTMSGDGDTIVADGATALIGAPTNPAQPQTYSTIALGRGLTVAGDARLEHANLQLGFYEYDPQLGYVTHNGHVAVATGGELDLVGPYSDINPYGSDNSISIAAGGVLRKSGDGTSTVNVPASGPIVEASGWIEFGYGASYTLAAGAHLDRIKLSGGTLTLAAGASIDELDIGGGTLVVAGDASVGDLTQRSGWITGDADLRVTNTLAWTGGSMVGDGATIIAPGATALIGEEIRADDPNARYSVELDRTLDVAGNVVFEQVSTTLGNYHYDPLTNGYIYDTGTIAIRSGGRVELSGPFSDFSTNFSNGGSIAIAAGGTLVKTGGGTSTISGPIAIDNGGSLSATDGRLETPIGDFGSLDDPTGTPPGVVVAYGETFTLEDGMDIAAINVQGGTLLVEGNAHVGTLTVRDGTVSGPGDLTIDTSFTWAGGQMIGVGRTILADGATVLIGLTTDPDNPGARTYNNLMRQFDVLGDATINQVQLAIGGYGYDSDGQYGLQRGQLHILSGGRAELRGGLADMSGYVEQGSSQVLVDAGGTFEKSGAGTATIAVVIDGPINQTGGVLALTSGASYTLAAGQHLDALILNGGTLRLGEGASIGDLDVQSGTVIVDGDASVTDLSFASGLLSGVGDLTITHEFDWSGGSMRDTGRTILAEGATGTIGGAGTIDNPSTTSMALGRTFDVDGHLSIDRAQVYVSYYDYDDQGDYGLRPGGFDIGGTGSLTLIDGQARISRYQEAGFIKVADGGVLKHDGSGTGSIGVDIEGAIAPGSGPIVLESGASYTLGAGRHLDALILNGGTLRLEDGASIGNLDARSGTLLVAGDAAIDDLRLTSAGLLGDGDLTIGHHLEWTGGNMRGSGRTIIADGATATIGGQADPDNPGAIANMALGRVLAIDGHVSIEQAQLLVSFYDYDEQNNYGLRQGGIDIAASGSFTLTGALASVIRYYDGGFVRVADGGTLTHVGAGVASIGLPIDGEIAPDSGPIILRSGATYTVAAGTHLDTLILDGGTLRLESGATVDDLDARSGSVVVAGDATIVDLRLASGTLSGEGDLTITHEFDWLGGQMVGLGTTIIADGATATFGHDIDPNNPASPAYLQLGREIEIHSDATIERAQLQLYVYGYDDAGNYRPQPGVITVAAGASLDLVGPYSDIYGNVEGSGIGVDPAGLLTKSGGGTSSIGVDIDGTFTAIDGVLSLEYGAHYTLADGAHLDTLRINGGTLTLEGDATIGDLDFVTGEIQREGVLTIARSLDWSGGSMNGLGGTVIADGAQALLGHETDPDQPQNPNYIYLVGTLQIDGDARIEQGLLALGGYHYGDQGYQEDPAVVSVSTGGTLTFDGAFADVRLNTFAGGASYIENMGLIVKTGGGTSTLDDNILFINDGEVRIEDGIFDTDGSGGSANRASASAFAAAEALPTDSVDAGSSFDSADVSYHHDTDQPAHDNPLADAAAASGAIDDHVYG